MKEQWRSNRVLAFPSYKQNPTRVSFRFCDDARSLFLLLHSSDYNLSLSLSPPQQCLLNPPNRRKLQLNDPSSVVSLLTSRLESYTSISIFLQSLQVLIFILFSVTLFQLQKWVFHISTSFHAWLILYDSIVSDFCALELN